MRNGWSVTLEREGVVVAERKGPMDPFDNLLKKNGAAHVGCTYGMAQDFGKEKLSFYVNVTCDQTDESINEAGKLCFLKAMELVADGVALLDKEKKS